VKKNSKSQVSKVTLENAILLLFLYIVLYHSSSYKSLRLVFAKFYTPIHRIYDMNDDVAGRNG